MYNKPKGTELSNEHAGFLMGLGLNGHLSTMATLSVHEYLLKVSFTIDAGLFNFRSLTATQPG